ncbi:MAG: ATP-dependent Clp protease proteolytic subunit [Streptobacillus sp.]
MAIIPMINENGNITSVSSKLLEDRIVYISGEITREYADIIIGQLLYLDSREGGKDITMYINSPGGSVNAGLGIYDTMNFVKSDIVTVCVGQAASMGAFLLSSGTKGKRYALPNSEILIHQPLGGVNGQVTDIKIVSDHILKLKSKLASILSENTGQKYEDIIKDTERDNYMDSKEAMEYGLIDKIIGGIKNVNK